ncbi:hypothetical protein RRG08_020224 [Elysia crispata]|uniref:Uncharacterized protein n=1 Tax=Elysia crispata TaxID=231223 RepID=A0AAE1DR70_9GAST|nr:hypothetical protein RRG08_020224 [Elysia crispata]
MKAEPCLLLKKMVKCTANLPEAHYWPFSSNIPFSTNRGDCLRNGVFLQRLCYTLHKPVLPASGANWTAAESLPSLGVAAGHKTLETSDCLTWHRMQDWNSVVSSISESGGSGPAIMWILGKPTKPQDTITSRLVLTGSRIDSSHRWQGQTTEGAKR